MDDSLVLCVCGHVKGHHIMTAAFYHCDWIGCGCPKFIDTKEEYLRPACDQASRKVQMSQPL